MLAVGVLMIVAGFALVIGSVVLAAKSAVWRFR